MEFVDIALGLSNTYKHINIGTKTGLKEEVLGSVGAPRDRRGVVCRPQKVLFVGGGVLLFGLRKRRRHGLRLRHAQLEICPHAQLTRSVVRQTAATFNKQSNVRGTYIIDNKHTYIQIVEWP